VVVAAAAVLAAFGLPAIRGMLQSFQSGGGTRAMIDASLASARAIAAKNQRYAGLRFQQACDRQDPLNALKGSQYMIFVIHEEARKMGNDKTCFRAVPGVSPIKLPDGLGVMDLRVDGHQAVDSDGDIDSDEELRDTTSFMILFSPAGKLVVRDAQVRNRDGVPHPQNPDDSADDVFNSRSNICDYNTGIFLQDEDGINGLEEEPSRRSFVIYDRTRFKELYPDRAYSQYLDTLEPIYINPYTGRMIDR